MLDVWWIALIIGGLGCMWFYRRWSKLALLPSGPKGWPLVGNAFQQDPGHPHITWSEWADKYGEVYTINNFGTPLILCNSPSAIWELLVTKSNDFAGRPLMYPQRYVTDDGRDVIIGDFDSHWAYRKKVFVTSFKMYGDGVERLETIMLDIITELVEHFQGTKQQPFDPFHSMQLALVNTLALLLLGDRFEYTDPDFLSLLDYIAQGNDLSTPSLEYFLIDSCPWLHYTPLPICKVMDRYMDGLMKNWIPKMIQKRMPLYNEDSPGCVLDAFIKQHRRDMKTKVNDALEMRHILALCQNVFIAGMLTSSSTMYTMIAILTAKPEIQGRARAEIDQALGGRHPKLQDKQSMPYFQAMFEEVLRYAIIVNGLPHRAIVDSSICGHFVPKDTMIWPNVWHMCHDPDVFEDPWTFKPERFLDENGDFLPADHPARKHVLIFGAGRRICAGEQLARNRIFLITTSLLQNFVFEPAAENQLPQYDPRSYPPGIVIKPKPYKIRAIPRD